jgi:CDP-diacylglycerol--glycerol-3-phosphate 3-phosphatidyltransferase
MKFNLPNALTWFRVVAIPLIVIVFYAPELFAWPESWARPAAGLLFALAGISDFFDGYLARRLGLTSNFGAFLDPVADKLIVSTALVLLVQADPQITLSLVAAVIIGREITVSALREWMSQIGARAHVAVNFFGKWKTTFQIVGIALMLYRARMLGFGAYLVGEVLLYVAAALTLWSMIEYLRAAWPAIRGAEDAGTRR